MLKANPIRCTSNRIIRGARSVLTLNRGREFRTILHMLSPHSSETLLDVGSGDGFWTSRFARYFGGVTGIEPDEELMHYAQSLYSPCNVRYIKGRAEELPFPDSSFDKAASISCLEHFADPTKALHEIARVLRPNGIFALSVDSLLAENSEDRFREWHRNKHFVTHYYSEVDLLTKMQSAGFSCDKANIKHLFGSRVSSRFREVYIRNPRLLLPLFPFLYVTVNVVDSFVQERHGQIIIVRGKRSAC